MAEKESKLSFDCWIGLFVCGRSVREIVRNRIMIILRFYAKIIINQIKSIVWDEISQRDFRFVHDTSLHRGELLNWERPFLCEYEDVEGIFERVGHKHRRY